MGHAANINKKYTIHIHTYVHTYIYTYIQTYIQTHICTQAYTHIHIHKHIHTYIHTYKHTHTHTHTYLYMTLPWEWKRAAKWMKCLWIKFRAVKWGVKTVNHSYVGSHFYVYVIATYFGVLKAITRLSKSYTPYENTSFSCVWDGYFYSAVCFFFGGGDQI